MVETELDVHRRLKHQEKSVSEREERLRKRREKDRARKTLVASSESQEERARVLEYK